MSIEMRIDELFVEEVAPREPTFSERVDEVHRPLAGLDPTHPIGRQFDPLLTPEAVSKLSDTDRRRLEERVAEAVTAALASVDEKYHNGPIARSIAATAARMTIGLQEIPEGER